MSHPFSWRSGDTGNESSHGLFHVIADPLRTLLFVRTTDLAAHHYSISIGIIVKHLHHIEMFQSVHGITADADASRLTHSQFGQLIDDFIRECPGTGYDSDPARGMDISRHDPDFDLAGRNHSGAIGPN